MVITNSTNIFCVQSGGDAGPRVRLTNPGVAWRMRLVFVLVFTAWLTPWRAAVAAEPGACAVAAMLTELTASERQALVQVCEGDAAASEAALQSAIFRAVSLSGWRNAALARLLAPLRDSREVVLPRGAAAATDMANARERLARTGCSELTERVNSLVTARAAEATDSPFLHDDALLAGCLAPPEREVARAPRPAGGSPPALPFRSVRLVTVRADIIEELFVVAAAPDFAVVRWFQPGDALVFGDHRMFVVPVPPGAAVALVARLKNTDVPAVWGKIVSDDEVAWRATPPLTCINLDVRLGPGAAVYVDGTPVPRDEGGVSRVVTVTSDAHEVVALECPAGGEPCHVRYRETLPARSTATNNCHVSRLDLAARTRETITVLDATQGEACREAPLRADGLRQGASEHLTRTYRATHEFRDLAAYAAATDSLSALGTRLNSTRGTTTGANAGADGTDLIGTAAKEAWRQGLDVLLSFDLQCLRRGDAWTYRLTATRVALGSMFRRGRYSGQSLELRSFVKPVTEEFHAAERLPVALVSVIDRSLGRAYVRLLADRTARPYRGGAPLTLQRYPGPPRAATCVDEADATCQAASAGRSAVVRARRLTLGGARPDLCRQLEQTHTPAPELLAAADRAFAAGRGAPIDLPVRRDAGGDLLAYTDQTRLRGALPGWYLLLAKWADDEAPRSAVCVELVAPRREIWTDVTMSLRLAPQARPDRLYARARAGYMHYLRPVVGLGIVVGYAHTTYGWADGRPAWLDLGAVDTRALEWKRNALLLGGSVELRAPFPRLPFELRLRATPTLSLGLLQLDKIPPGLTQFRGGGKGNLDVDLDVHFDAIVGYDLGKITMQHILLLGLHAINDPLRRNPIDVRENGGFFIGLGLGLGFGGRS